MEVFITENGWSDDGQLADYERISYLRVFAYFQLYNESYFYKELSIFLGAFIIRFGCHSRRMSRNTLYALEFNR